MRKKRKKGVLSRLVSNNLCRTVSVYSNTRKEKRLIHFCTQTERMEEFVEEKGSCCELYCSPRWFQERRAYDGRACAVQTCMNIYFFNIYILNCSQFVLAFGFCSSSRINLLLMHSFNHVFWSFFKTTDFFLNFRRRFFINLRRSFLKK